jgi:Ribosomal protein S9
MEEGQQVSTGDEKKKPARRTRKSPAKQKLAVKVIFTKSKRKSSVARASAVPGKGIIRVNSVLMDVIEPEESRMEMLKGVYLSEAARQIAEGLDINVNVYGGGTSSRAQAVAGAIARAIVEVGGDSMKSLMMQYDRRLIKDDPRRVEPKKFLGPKARARFQTSYR